MTEPQAVYRILSRVHVARWDDQLQDTVPGWELKALWLATGTVIPVFLPDAQYSPANIDTLVRAAGALDNQVHALGG